MTNINFNDKYFKVNYLSFNCVTKIDYFSNTIKTYLAFAKASFDSAIASFNEASASSVN